jgi:hypothetical protein
LEFEPASDEFCEMVRCAALAGACRIVARMADTDPAEADELMNDAEEHSGMAATILTDLMNEPGLTLRLVPRRR